MELLISLGIDKWSILLYLVNFGVIFLVLRKYLFYPLVKYLDERRALIKDSIASAESARREFASLQAKHDLEMKQQMAQLESEVQKVRLSATQEAEKLIQEAEQRREKMIVEAQKQIDSAKNAMISEIETEIIDKIQRAIVFVLGHKVPLDVVKASVQDGWKEMR